MKKSIACIIALLAFGMAGAMAEEMAGPPSQFITARVPYLAWTGFYVGINGGFAWGNSSVAFAPNDPAALAGTCGGGGAPKGQCINSVDFHRDGAIAGGQVGFNWQVNSHWLVGAEADYQWSNLDGSVNSAFRLGNVGATNMVATQTVESFGTIRARAGVVLTPPLLLYGTGIRRRRFLAGLFRGHARRLELQVLGRFSEHPFPHVQNVKEPERLR